MAGKCALGSSSPEKRVITKFLDWSYSRKDRAWQEKLVFYGEQVKEPTILFLFFSWSFWFWKFLICISFCYFTLSQCRQYEESLNKQHRLKLAVTEMERTAQDHIFSLASESEAAISVSQEKLIEAHNKMEQFHRFIKVIYEINNNQFFFSLN